MDNSNKYPFLDSGLEESSVKQEYLDSLEHLRPKKWTDVTVNWILGWEKNTVINLEKWMSATSRCWAANNNSSHQPCPKCSQYVLYFYRHKMKTQQLKEKTKKEESDGKVEKVAAA